MAFHRLANKVNSIFSVSDLLPSYFFYCVSKERVNENDNGTHNSLDF